MRILLDTNILIYREANASTNYSIGHLFRWLDKLNHIKIIHPLSIDELKKAYDGYNEESLKNKISSYQTLPNILFPTPEFLSYISHYSNQGHDVTDNCLLFEVFVGRVDILITQDEKMHHKAKDLGIENRVYYINSFIAKCSMENPTLIEYDMLSVEKKKMCQIDLTDPFFDSFRQYYHEFDQWFLRKCDEEAYITIDQNNNIIGFLFLKIENPGTDYSDISPQFSLKKRMKISSFKIESTGFRLGERYLQIVFDNAKNFRVDEIYVTMFFDKPELERLESFLENWGFSPFGIKNSENGQERVLIKSMKEYDNTKNVRYNFPLLRVNAKKFILPIFPQFHTDLFPDSILNTEDPNDFHDYMAHRYALQKVYVSWADLSIVFPGDIALIYRMGDYPPKKYTSVLTSIVVIDQIWSRFRSQDDFLASCQNRSVFSSEVLIDFWKKHGSNPFFSVIKLIFVKSLLKKPTLQTLYDLKIVEEPFGPRPMTEISNQQFESLLKISQTVL